MTSGPRLARQTDEIIDWMQTMTRERFRRLPIVDDDDRIEAVLTQTDIVVYTWPKLMEQAAELARVTVRERYPIMLIFGGVLVYSLLLILILLVI